MSHTDDRRDKKLPVTAEVGGEGGSFADPTQQVATFDGDVTNVEETRSDKVAPDVVESDTAEGMRKFPTDT
jgi:hypothetical protein